MWLCLVQVVLRVSSWPKNCADNKVKEADPWGGLLLAGKRPKSEPPCKVYRENVIFPLGVKPCVQINTFLRPAWPAGPCRPSACVSKWRHNSPHPSDRGEIESKLAVDYFDPLSLCYRHRPLLSATFQWHHVMATASLVYSAELEVKLRSHSAMWKSSVKVAIDTWDNRLLSRQVIFLTAIHFAGIQLSVFSTIHSITTVTAMECRAWKGSVY